MPELHFPWLEFSILTPFLGALVVWWIGDRQIARNWSIGFCFVALLFAVGEWIDFSMLGAFEAHDPWERGSTWSRSFLPFGPRQVDFHSLGHCSQKPSCLRRSAAVLLG